MCGSLRSVSVGNLRKSSVGEVSRPCQPVTKGKVGKRGGMEGGRIEGEKKSENVSEARKRRPRLIGDTIGVVSMEEDLNSLIL